MKKLLPIFALCAAFCFAACNDPYSEDEIETRVESPTWGELTVECTYSSWEGRIFVFEPRYQGRITNPVFTINAQAINTNNPIEILDQTDTQIMVYIPCVPYGENESFRITATMARATSPNLALLTERHDILFSWPVWDFKFLTPYPASTGDTVQFQVINRGEVYPSSNAGFYPSINVHATNSRTGVRETVTYNPVTKTYSFTPATSDNYIIENYTNTSIIGGQQQLNKRMEYLVY